MHVHVLVLLLHHSGISGFFIIVIRPLLLVRIFLISADAEARAKIGAQRHEHRHRCKHRLIDTTTNASTSIGMGVNTYV